MSVELAWAIQEQVRQQQIALEEQGGIIIQARSGAFVERARSNCECGDQQARAVAERARAVAQGAGQPRADIQLFEGEARAAVEVFVTKSAADHDEEQRQRHRLANHSMVRRGEQESNEFTHKHHDDMP
eukprot:9027500-Pyramimonas_sp.AAC.1